MSKRFNIHAKLVYKVGSVVPNIEEVKSCVEAVREVEKTDDGMCVLYSDYEALKISQQWQPISTVPLGELVICLWGHRTIGTQIFDHPTDRSRGYAKYWMRIPPVPNDNERHA